MENGQIQGAYLEMLVLPDALDVVLYERTIVTVHMSSYIISTDSHGGTGGGRVGPSTDSHGGLGEGV